MGSILSTPSVERLFDGTASIIDLRPFTRTNNYNCFCNVFYVNSINKCSHLFIFYLDNYWYLGKVFNEKLIDDHNANESELLMVSGRRYLIHKNIPSYNIPDLYKDVESNIYNKITYISPIIK